MEIIKKEKISYLLKLQKGEEFIKEIEDFCRNNNIKAAWINAIGATNDLNIALYNLDTNEYEKHQFSEMLEVLNITGNISTKEGDVMCHAHGVFGRRDMSTLGGHIFKCKISATLEVHLQVFEGEVKREFDKETCLFLLSK